MDCEEDEEEEETPEGEPEEDCYDEEGEWMECGEDEEEEEEMPLEAWFGCRIWFDGCNVCSVDESGTIEACTEMECDGDFDLDDEMSNENGGERVLEEEESEPECMRTWDYVSEEEMEEEEEKVCCLE
jgi:hypothetical protein